MRVMLSFLRVIPDGARDGVLNMSADRFLFRQAIESKSAGAALRFYRFSEPTLTVGYAHRRRFKKNTPADPAVAYRITGGGIVRHGWDLIYSFVAPIELHSSFRLASESYLIAHQLLGETLRAFGCKPYLFEGSSDGTGSLDCFENPVRHDLMSGGMKIAGAGQRRSFGYFLQQGSIAWDVISQSAPDLTESQFKNDFVSRLAKLLGLGIQERPFEDDEWAVIKRTLPLETRAL